MMRGYVRYRSVVTSTGEIRVRSIARAKNRRAASLFHRGERNTSMTWPNSSMARNRYRQVPSTLTYVSSTCQRSPTTCCRARAASANSSTNRWTHRYTVTWSTLTPRSARSSSTSRYERPNRRYHRTARAMTSGGNRYPAKAERGDGAGQRYRCGLIARVSLKQVGATNATVPNGPSPTRSRPRPSPGHEGRIGGQQARRSRAKPNDFLLPVTQLRILDLGGRFSGGQGTSRLEMPSTGTDD